MGNNVVQIDGDIERLDLNYLVYFTRVQLIRIVNCKRQRKYLYRLIILFVPCRKMMFDVANF